MIRKYPSRPTVNSLPLGPGRGIVITKEGRKVIVNGDVVLNHSRDTKHLIAGDLSFGPGTRVKKWKQK